MGNTSINALGPLLQVGLVVSFIHPDPHLTFENTFGLYLMNLFLPDLLGGI